MARISRWVWRTGPPAHATALSAHCSISSSVLVGVEQASGRAARGQVPPQPSELCGSGSRRVFPDGHSPPCSLRGLLALTRGEQGVGWRRGRSGKSSEPHSGSVWQLSSRDSRHGSSDPERDAQPAKPACTRAPEKAAKPRLSLSTQTWWRGKACGTGNMQQGTHQECGDMESLTRRASSREWAGHAGTREPVRRRWAGHAVTQETGRRNALLNLCEFYAERSHQSTGEQDWGTRAPACDVHLYDVRPSFERVDWKFPNFTVTLALGIAERDENGTKPPNSFDTQLFLVRSAKPSTYSKDQSTQTPPLGGGSPLEIFLSTSRMEANDMAAIRQRKKEEKRAQEERDRAKDILGWRDVAAAQKKTTQERQQEAARAAEEKKIKREEAGANMATLEASLGQMRIKEHEVTSSKLEITTNALSKAGVPNPLRGPNAMGTLGIHVDAAEVCAKKEEIVTGQESVIQAVSMCGKGTPGVGKLFLVVSEQEPLNKLSRDSLMAYMRSVNMDHVKAIDIEGVTTTLRQGAQETAVPNIFEITLKLSEQLTVELLTAIQGRRATIAGIACTLALETSHSMSLTFGLGDRKKLGAVWKIMQAFDMDQDKLHLVVTAAVREALATRNENPEMAASLVGATLQRQIGPRDNKMRLSIRDITDERGPNFRIMFAKEGAPGAFQGLIVPIRFGQGDGLIWLEGMGQQQLNEGREPGMEAARARAQKRCTAIMQEAEQVLSEVKDITQEEVRQEEDEENAGVRSAANITKILSAITSLSGLDVTSDFVKEELMRSLREPGDHRSRCQRMLAAAGELRAEVTRRRRLLSSLMFVTMAPFPELEDIHMQWGKLKSDIRMMNENATRAAEDWLRSLELKQGTTLSFMVAELVVTKGRPKWDNKAGIVVVFQAAQQLSGVHPVFEEAGNAAGGEAGWKNAGLRQTGQGEKIATKINIQVMTGRKKTAASEQIRTKTQEVRIRMVEAKGSALFAEEEKEAEKTLLRRYARKGIGIWVPLNWTTGDGEEKLTVLSTAAGLPITKLSALPENQALPFYIRNIASELRRHEEEAYDGVLETLGELVDSKEMLPVKYDKEWVIYLDPALARELQAEEMEAGGKMNDDERISALSFVAVGGDTSEVVWALAQDKLFKNIVRAAGEGLWIDWFPHKSVWQSVKLQDEAVPQGTKGSRWIGDICECAVTIMAKKHNDTILLKDSTEKALAKHGSLLVFKGGETVGLILYANTIRSRQLRSEATKAGGSLPAAELTDEVVSKFEATCRKAATAEGAMVIALVTKGDVPLPMVRAEWSEEWRNPSEAEVKLPTIVEVVEEEWKEQMSGTTAAAMLQEIIKKGTAAAVQTEWSYIVIFTGEGTSTEGLARGVTWQDQFGTATGEGVKEKVAKLLRHMGRNTGRDKGVAIQSSVKQLSKARLSEEIDVALNAGPCVIAGASARGVGSSASLQEEPWGGAIPDVDMRRVIRHPGAREKDFLHEVMEGILNNEVRYEAVNNGKGVLVLPGDPGKKWSFSEWKAGDPRFRQWKPTGENALETLSKMPPSAGEEGTSIKKKRAGGHSQQGAEQPARTDDGDEVVEDRDEGAARSLNRQKGEQQ